MVHGIGEYVHARQENYKKFGLGRSERRGMSFTQAYNQAKNELLSYVGMSATPLNVADLETTFSQLRKGLANSAQAKASGSQVTDALDDYFMQQVDAYFSAKGHQVNYDTLTVESAQTIFSQAKMNYDNKHQNPDSYFQLSTWNKFEEKFRQIVKQFQAAQSQGLLDASTIARMSATITDLNQRRQALATAIQTHGIKSQYIPMKNLFEAYNAFVDAYSMPSRKELGDLAEFVASYLSLRAAGKAHSEIKRLIKETIMSPVGAQRSVTTYDFPNFIDDERLGLPAYRSVTRTGQRNFQVSLGTSQDTLDIITEFNGDSLRASVKNVASMNNKYGVHIISAMPLTALFNLVNTDFVNHYMNLLVFKQKSELANTTEIWEKATVVRALTGARASGNLKLANTFIINDRDSGKIKIFAISDLLNTILRVDGRINEYVKVKGKGFPPKSLENKWVGQANSYIDAGKRVAQVFSQLHSIKLNASLMPAAFKISPIKH